MSGSKKKGPGKKDETNGVLLPFRPGRGGRRKGAGRKPKGEVAGVSHRPRAALASRFPVHVTVSEASRPARRRRSGGVASPGAPEPERRLGHE